MFQFHTMGNCMFCSFGVGMSVLNVIPKGPLVMQNNKLVATIMDNIPVANIPPFGACSSPMNPAVVAAGGVPQPCTPMTTSSWVNIKPCTVSVNNVQALEVGGKLICSYGGIITAAPV